MSLPDEGGAAAPGDRTPETPSPDEANGPMATAAGMAGNILEWYDFAVFGFFSDVIARNFFPPTEGGEGGSAEYGEGDPSGNNLVRSFAVFGGAFLMRPIGGVVIGYCGDKFGRKRALVQALLLMAVPTTAMGCLPTYARAGGWSTALLVVCRLLQGMSVGGQLPASLVYTVETRPREQWGLYGSLVMMAANVGTLLGNLIGALIRTVLTDEQLLSWGWRIPFLSGMLIAFVAVYLRAEGREHHPNAGVYDGDGGGGEASGLEKNGDARARPKHPLAEVCRSENLPGVLSAMLTTSMWAGGFYISFVWMATYMHVLVDPPIKGSFWVNAMSLMFGIVLPLPLAGALADRVGLVKVMIVGALSFGLLGPILMWAISRGGAVPAFFAQWTIGLFLSLFGGPMNAWLVSLFPVEHRLTAAALGYDLAHCTAGGFSPLVATVLVNSFGPLAPASLYPLLAALALLGIFISMRIRPSALDPDVSVISDEASMIGEPLL